MLLCCCSSGSTTLSASGMLFMGSDGDGISSRTVFVLTAASVIEPFLLKQYRDNTLQVGSFDISSCAQEIACIYFFGVVHGHFKLLPRLTLML